jgi:hypothetical protein
MFFIAKMNTINPATSKAAPANKLISEFEPFMESHINSPNPIAAVEIIISRRCAWRIRGRGRFNGIVQQSTFLGYSTSGNESKKVSLANQATRAHHCKLFHIK